MTNQKPVKEAVSVLLATATALLTKLTD